MSCRPPLERLPEWQRNSTEERPGRLYHWVCDVRIEKSEVLVEQVGRAERDETVASRQPVIDRGIDGPKVIVTRLELPRKSLEIPVLIPVRRRQHGAQATGVEEIEAERNPIGVHHRLATQARQFETLEQARSAIGAYIDRYHHRPHSSLAYRTPSEVAQTWKDHDDHLTPAA